MAYHNIEITPLGSLGHGVVSHQIAKTFSLINLISFYNKALDSFEREERGHSKTCHFTFSFSAKKWLVYDNIGTWVKVKISFNPKAQVIVTCLSRGLIKPLLWCLTPTFVLSIYVLS